MPSTILTRRQFFAASAGVPLILQGRTETKLENAALSFRLTIGDGAITERGFENRLTRRSIALPTTEFQLEFDHGSTVSSSDCKVRLHAAGEDALTLLFSHASGLEVRVRYRLPPQAAYLRKEISVRDGREAGRKLLRADLENWTGVSDAWDSLHGDRYRFGSHPVFCEDLWAGVEFVAAFNTYGPDGFTLGSRPGGPSVGPAWLELRPTVVGVSRRGGVRDAFLRYLEDIRLSPPRIVACYNSWWTLPKVVKQADNLALIAQLKAGMFDRHGVFFDIITTDMGWSNPRSIWEIDRSVLPRGFDDIRAIVEPAGGRLGLWMSPSEVYPPVCDYDWAERSGYVVLRPEAHLPADRRPVFARPGISLADPKYREEAKAQLRKLIRENGLAHIKYDGFWAIEQRAHHALLAGDDSVEPLAAHALELLQASKEANPELVTEPTCMNSRVNYISPWILKYSDTVWANAEDCVVGVGPAPIYRDSHTNGREFMVFQSLDQVWLPQNAVQYFDIVHVDAAEGFPNHAAMAFGRGRFFLATYVNPQLMSDEDWRIYAGLLRWARGNAEILRNTVMIPSRLELGEPYLYAHWLRARGIIAVRNPSNHNREYVVDLAAAGAPEDLADGVCYSQYPCRRGLATNLTARSRVTLDLAPWEVRFLEVAPRGQLRETVVIGARWYREKDGATSIVPDAEVRSVQVIQPGRRDERVTVIPRQTGTIAGAVTSHAVRKLPEPEWLAAKPRTVAVFPFRYPAEPNPDVVRDLQEKAWKDVKWQKVPSVGFELECTVTIPPANAGQILLLVEFPGRVHRPSRCAAVVDGRPVKLEERRSDEHIGYYNWTEKLRPAESEWTWYICDVESGTHGIRFSGVAGNPNPPFAVWAWAEHKLTDRMSLPLVRCSEPAMPQYEDQIERRGICILARATLGAS